MHTKTRLLVVVTLMLLGLAIATTINVSLNFRDYSIKSAVEKAKLTATVVKDGLTAHMVHGIMDKRQFFLDQVSANDDIKALWIVRGKKVIDQYGEGFNTETLRDAIDAKVLKTGKMHKEVIESIDNIYLRVTIPFIATSHIGNPNCINCHNVNRKDTLGAISMKYDISTMRTNSFFTISKILAINLLFIVVALFLINYYITPFLKMFANLQEGIKKAYTGDFTHRFKSKAGGDADKVVEQLNILFEKMQETFGEIKINLSTFIPGGSVSSNDPLHEAKTIIRELSDIYKFKKTIELDENKILIYERIKDILEIKFNLKHFSIYEIDNKHNSRKLIYMTDENADICYNDSLNEDAIRCRAYRTNSNVISTEFKNLCNECKASNIEYLCIPFNINEDASLIISITAKDKDEINTFASYITSIKNYLEAAKPVIESRILMEKLHDTSLRDGMTNLYNRRFLEEFIDQIMSQVQREENTYHIMMIDVDFFKMVNDTYGHDVGDKVIIELANILKENIRDADLAIRYGGEEFIVMLHNATDQGALHVANKVHLAFAKLVFDVGSNEKLQKTISIGISKFPTDGDTIWKCIKFADIALYEAKNTGRNKIIEFKPEMLSKDMESNPDY